MTDEKIPLDKVLEDMCFHEIGWVQDAAKTYFHENYLHEKKLKTTNESGGSFGNHDLCGRRCSNAEYERCNDSV